MSPPELNRVTFVLRWLARLSSAALLLIWGAFFIEHLSWFTQPGQTPPMRVFLLQGLHLMMLVGLMIGWRWEWAGALLVLGSSLPFFAHVAGPRFVIFATITAVPAVLWIISAWLSHSHPPATTSEAPR